MTEPEVPAPQPESTIGDRDRTARERDRTSQAHDRLSDAHDDRADERDARAQQREDQAGQVDPDAVADRAGARGDRRRSAGDRRRAEDDRDASASDRALAAVERASLVVDGLTGAHHREPGLVELDRELVKARRTGVPYVLAFLDVDGLKNVNDSQGHAAGDLLLRDVVRIVRAAVREYDLVIRYGGDEFVCGLLDLSLDDAYRRFASTMKNAADNDDVSFSYGLAVLGESDTRDDLIARADAAMYTQRERRVAIE